MKRRSVTRATRASRERDAEIRLLVPDLPKAGALMPWLARIDANRWYTNGGPLVARFEAALAARVRGTSSAPHCVTTSSGTTALELALAAFALPPGARVLVPSYTFPATANAVVRAGLVPVLADVCLDSWTLTPSLAHALAEKHDCSAVVPVAVFGVPMPIERWDEFARSTGRAVLIDAAAALGVVTAAEAVTVAYSLHATKPLGIGEGGVVATRDAALAQRIRTAANHGFNSARVAAAGTNARMSEYAAAVGLAQLQRASRVLARRRSVWQRYRDAFRSDDDVAFQRGLDDCAPAVLVVTTPRPAEEVAEALAREGIETRRWYHPPLHEHPAYERFERATPDASGELLAVDRIARHAIGLPFHTRLSARDVERVADAVRAAVRARRARRPNAAAAAVAVPEPAGTPT